MSELLSHQQATSIRGMNVLRLPNVMARIGLSRSTIYHLMSRGAFPAPIRLGVRAVGWRESDLADWLAQRQSARAQAVA